MALWEQLHTTSIPINWRIFLDRNSLKSTVHLWRNFSVSQWTNPKHTFLLTARSNRFLFGKECIPQELFKSRCTFSYLRQPLRIDRRGRGTFHYHWFHMRQGWKFVLFQAPTQRADPSENFQLSSHNYWKQLESDCSVKWVSLSWYSWNKSLWVNSTLFFSSTLYGYKNHTIFYFYYHSSQC